MWENSKRCSKGGKCKDHKESCRRLLAVCEKGYFFLGMGQARKWEYLVHHPTFCLGQGSFSSPLLNVHFVYSWTWQMTMQTKRERETRNANSEWLWRQGLCHCCELLAVIEANPTLPFHIFIALGFHTTTFTSLRYDPPVHLMYPSLP